MKTALLLLVNITNVLQKHSPSQLLTLSMEPTRSATSLEFVPEKESTRTSLVEPGSDTTNISDVYIEKMKTRLNIFDLMNSSNELDGRRTLIRDEYRLRMKSAPQTLVQKTEEKKDPIERKLEESDHKLQNLLEFGQELVTNVQVANEKREQMRRAYEIERSRVLKNDLEKESIESIARFNEIASKWSELEEFKEPMALFEHLEGQKKKVEALMASKDNLIGQCQREIDRINAKYYADQMADANDVRCLVERIDRQIEVIKMAYKSHLEILENTINEQRQTIAVTEANKWSKFYADMEESEKTKFDLAKQKEEFYAAEIARITAVQKELTSRTRIRLEKEAEMLEWELRKVRNTVLMNSEKLDYNYQVLQKRNEENVVISNQQKRRLAKLNENIASLKLKITTINEQHQTQLQRSVAEIHKLHKSISELEVKAQQFRANNKRKFDLVWEINFKELKELLTKIYKIDGVLYEQQLAMPWSMPELDLADINEISNKEHRSSLKAMKRRNTIVPPRSLERKVETSFVRNILRKIADRAGFLIEEKLFKILEPYSENDKFIVRLDNIFIALRVDNVKMISTLTECFVPYAYCPNCSEGLPKKAMQDFYRIGREFEDLVSTDDSSSEMPTEGSLESHDFIENEYEKNFEKLKERPSCKNHYLVIEPVFVLTALNDFTKRQMQNEMTYKKSLETNELLCNTISLDHNTIKSFWSKFKVYFPQEKRKLWITLEHGLNHYVEVLKLRTKLDEECAFLRRQNMELKHLLQKFTV
ncbi:PREDICTED: dynein regulatory complex protein 1 homolog [Rhagoletis zephyria]|uniref:dynein regulatory complex protein 1 homolog n=1 Tax=Rhagoletis zephyria TaxID=28612 RepID=UPI0008119807|nr:PREDICTED: dynein regulatory complex protein 1 homolog [Rhagoletis zephyria]